MGIYLHVPFCRSKCYYCGFYSVASPLLQQAYLEAVGKEIVSRRDYLPERKAETLYLGGGTPSLLGLGELEKLVGLLEDNFYFSSDAERTLEVNPEDITPSNLSGWRQLGFNRLSIGVQSFSDPMLGRLNRRHTGREAKEGILLAAGAGFERLSIDLMAGLPAQTEDAWQRDLETAMGLPVTHLSVYLLSVDSGTVFEVMRRRGELSLPGEEQQALFFSRGSELLCEAGFEHYEISNFAKAGMYSRHNIAYWQQKPYVGFGPAAHSYNGNTRQWNVAHLGKYIKAQDEGGCYEREQLSETDLYNEYVMTRLRTMWGVELPFMEQRYAGCLKQTYAAWEQALEKGFLIREGEHLRMSKAGWLLSDTVFSDLFAL